MASNTIDPTQPDENHSYQIYVTVGVAGFAAISTTLIRVTVKWTHSLRLTWDDYLIILGTVSPLRPKKSLVRVRY